MKQIEKPMLNNMELINYHDLEGKPGFQMALQIVNGKSYLYVARYYHVGWSVLDVTDVNNIKHVNIDEPRGKEATVTPKVQVADGLMIAALGQRTHFLSMPGVNLENYDAGIEIFDVKGDPMNPKFLGFWSNEGGAGIDGINTHRNYFDGGRYVHATSSAPGFRNGIYRIIDIIDPKNPVEVGRWWLNEQWMDGKDYVERNPLDPKSGYKHYHLHMPQIQNDKAYLAYSGYGLIILDIADVTRPKYLGSLRIDPPYSTFISCHTALPMSGKNSNYLILTEEAAEARQAGFAGIVDISDPAAPTLVSQFPNPQIPADASFGNYLAKGGPIGWHNFHQSQGHPDLEDREDRQYSTNFNAGVRVWDISDIYNVREIASYIPKDPEKNAWPIPDMLSRSAICANPQDLLVDKRGYIYVTDSNGGLSILRCTV